MRWHNSTGAVMDFATRYDFLKMSIARYDGYYNLAAVKASLLLTSTYATRPLERRPS